MDYFLDVIIQIYKCYISEFIKLSDDELSQTEALGRSSEEWNSIRQKSSEIERRLG